MFMSAICNSNLVRRCFAYTKWHYKLFHMIIHFCCKWYIIDTQMQTQNFTLTNTNTVITYSCTSVCTECMHILMSTCMFILVLTQPTSSTTHQQDYDCKSHINNKVLVHICTS